MKAIQRLLAVIAVLFGIATLVAGGSVFFGSDPGYQVYRPLLAYNTAMGIAYIGAGILAWLSVRRGKYAAAVIFALNLAVLGAVGYLYTESTGVAIESLRAMTLRTVVWFVLFLGLAWLGRRQGRNEKRDA